MFSMGWFFFLKFIKMIQSDDLEDGYNVGKAEMKQK